MIYLFIVLPSTSAYCNIQTFLLSLLNNNFNKKILTVTFHNVITTIQPIQVMTISNFQ